MKRRAISFITVLALCLSLCPTQALAAGWEPDALYSDNTPAAIASDVPSNKFVVSVDTTASGSYDVTKPMVFDTCGHSYIVTDAAALRVTRTGSLYLTNGTIQSKKEAGVEVQTGGFLCVNDADMEVTGKTYGLDIASGATVQLSGGKFTGQQAAIRTGDGDFGALLMTGFAYFDDSGDPIPLTAVAGETTVAVKECTAHSYSYTPNPDGPTHDEVCDYCGKTTPSRECEFDFDEDGQAVCHNCGRTLTVTISKPSGGLVYNGELQPNRSDVSVTVTLDGKTPPLTENDDYNVILTTRRNAGETAEVTVSGIIYKWAFRKAFGVIKDTPEITWKNAQQLVFSYEADKAGLLSKMEAALLSNVKIGIKAAGEDLSGDLRFSFKDKDDSSAGFTDGLPTNAGTYEIKASLPASANYNAASSAPVVLAITPIDPTIEAPVAVKPAYNGAAQKLVTSGAAPDGAEIQFAVSEEGPWSKDIPTGTDAGDYMVWYRVVDKANNYNTVEATLISSVKIRRKEITPAVVLEYYTCVYDGGDKEPKVTVRDPDDWKELPGTEYEVAYYNNQNVGTAIVTVTSKDKGNYKFGETDVTFAITPADQAGLTITNTPGSVFYGDVFTLETTGGSGNGTVTWEIVSPSPKEVQDGDTEIVTDYARINIRSGQVTVTGVGTVIVRATKSGADNDGNHKDATAEWTFTSEKRRVTATVAAANKTYDGTDAAAVTAEVRNGVVSGDTITITGLTGTFSGAGAGTNKTVTVDTENVKIKVNGAVISGTEDKNYIITIPGTTTADIGRAAVKITTAPTAAALTYTGSGQQLLSAAAKAGFTTTVKDPETIPVEYALSKDGTYGAAVPSAANAGSYEVWYRVQDGANYTGIPAAKVDVTIEPKSVDNPYVTLSNDSYEYDGYEKEPAVTVKESAAAAGVIPSDEYTVTYRDNINVGTATVTVTDKEGGNYTVKTTSVTFSITKDDNTQAVLTSRPQARDLTYNGSKQNLVTAGEVTGGHMEYAVTGPDDESEEETDKGLTYSRIIPQGDVAGTYTVYYKVVGDGNYADNPDGAGSVEVTIKPKTVTDPVITLNLTTITADFTGTYNGNPQKPAVTSVADGDVTIDPDEYGVTYSGNTNAGTATVHIVDEYGGNYTVSGSATFTIAKAASAFGTKPGPSAAAAQVGDKYVLACKGRPLELVTAGAAALPAGGKVVYSLDGGDYSDEIPVGTARKDYTVLAKVQGDGLNYDDSEPVKIEVTIGVNQVAQPKVILSSAVFCYTGGEQTPTVTVYDGDDDEIPADEYTLRYFGVADQAAVDHPIYAGAYKITITSKADGNYDFTVDCTFTITPAEQTALTITGKPSLIHYGDLFSLDATGGSGDGAISWSTNNNGIAEINPNSGLVKVTGVGTVTITVTKAASTDGNYKAATAPWTFTAVQAAAQLAALPKPAPGLTYTGGEQTLLMTGATTANGIGKVKYSLNKDGVYDEAIPAAIKAGAYKVWYKVEGNNNYTGIDPDYVEVTIGRKELDAKTSNLTVTWKNSVNEVEGVRIVVTYVDDDGKTIEIDRSEYTAKVTTDGWETKQWISVTVTARENGNYKFELSELIEHPSNEGFIEETDSPGVGGGDGPGIDDPGVSNGPSASGSSKGGATSTPGTSASKPGAAPNTAPEPAEPDAPDEPEEESPSVRTTEQDGAASTVVNGAAADQLVDEAIANQSGNVVIRPEITGDVTKTEVSIPASAVSRIGNETDAALTVSTPVADVTIPNGALERLSGAEGAVSVTAERAENTVVLTLSANGEEVGDIPGGLTLTVPVEDAGPGTVAVLIRKDGTRETVRKSAVEGDMLRVPLNGSVTLEIVDNSKEFSDVPAGNWAADAVAFASAHEMFNGTSGTTFSPELTMSRAMLATVLYNLEGRPDQSLTNEFSDVSSGAWYSAGVSWAAANGITGGYGNGRFGPNDGITREQFVVMLWRYAGNPAAGEQTLNFTDADQASVFAMEALYWATENGILNGYGNGRLDPRGLATRAQAAQILKNFIENT